MFSTQTESTYNNHDHDDDDDDDDNNNNNIIIIIIIPEVYATVAEFTINVLQDWKLR